MLGSVESGLGSVKTAQDVGTGTASGLTITSTDGSVAITNPTGPTVNLSVAAAALGPAPPAIGNQSAGVAASVSRSDHSHPFLSVATSADLAALDASNMLAGTIVKMTSRGCFLHLQQSALATDGIGIFAALNKAGWVWFRMRIGNPANQAITAWHVDPQSVQAAASDDNNGTAAGTPLATMQELAFRTEGARYATTACVVRLYSDMASTDFAFFNVRGNGSFPSSGAVSPAGFDCNFTIVGVPRNVTGFAGVVANVQTATLGSLLRWQFTDAGIPVSWTASGFLARSLIFQRTNGTAAKWWPVLDQGGAAPNALLQISQPTTNQAQNGANQPVLANADTYQILTLPALHRIRFPSSATQSDYQIAFVFNDDAASSIPLSMPLVWAYCSFNVAQFLNGQFFNCQFPQSPRFSIVEGGTQWCQVVSGTIRGTSASTQCFSNFGSTVEIGNEVGAFTTFEKASLTADEQSRFTRIAAMFYDTTTALIVTVGNQSMADVNNIGGTANTNKILKTTRCGCTITYDLAGAPNPAMSTDVVPFQTTAGSFAVLPQPVAANLEGIYQR